jgi:hypothetical protein
MKTRVAQTLPVEGDIELLTTKLFLAQLKKTPSF